MDQTIPQPLKDAYDNTMTPTEQDEGSLWLPVILGFTVLTAWMVFTFFAGRWYERANAIATAPMVRPEPCIVVPTILPTIYDK